MTGGDFQLNCKILFDWLSFTARDIKPERMTELLDLDDVEWAIVDRNAHGFKRRYYFNGINIHFDNPQFEGVWVEFSGQGCRAFDEFSPMDWSVLFALIIDNEFHLTRLDVAYDDREKVLNLDKIYREVENQNYVSNMISWDTHNSNKGKTVYIGSMKSDIMFRVYDKSRERGREDEGHWIRFEMQLRNDRALEFIKKLRENDIGSLFNGVLENYLRFVIPSKTDSNKRRWKSQKWWTKFTNKAKAISLWTPCDTNYNITKCENYVYKHAGNAISTLLQIKGSKQFYKDLQKNRPQVVSEKYHSLLAEYGKTFNVQQQPQIEA